MRKRQLTQEDYRLCDVFAKWVTVGAERTAVELNMTVEEVLKDIEMIKARMESMIAEDEGRLN